MIRSIFDTDDSPEEEKKAVEANRHLGELSITEPVERVEAVAVTEESTPVNSRSIDDPAISSGEPEKQIVENVRDAEITVDLASTQEFPEVSSVPTSKLENVVDAGEDFLEFENEINKIEEEVKLEKKSNVEIPANPFIERSELRPVQTGIFTAALEKRENEKQMPVPLEDLLIVPDGSLNENDNSEAVNTGFILPNRTEPEVENQGFILPNRTEPTSDEAPNILDFKPESKAEIIRQSGLAWTAGIAFFASVVFLLIIGWFADLLLGTGPWGAVTGIVLGSIIGFVQLFRLTSQILKNSDQ